MKRIAAALVLTPSAGSSTRHCGVTRDLSEAFREAQTADASLALAYWLEALTYSRVIWDEEKLGASRLENEVVTRRWLSLASSSDDIIGAQDHDGV